MVKIKKNKVVYLYEDIIFNILIRIPFDTLLNFRFVCKLWATMILDPIFIKSNHYQNQFCLILQSPQITRFIDICKSGTCTSVRDVGSSCKEIRSSCRSLILIADNVLRGTLHIVNHVTTERILLPLSDSLCEHKCNCGLGIGYVHATREYKIVHVYVEDGVFRCEILSLNSTSYPGWRKIKGPDYTGERQYYWDDAILTKPDILNWDAQSSEYIISMCLSDEKFRRIQLPRIDSQFVHNGYKFLEMDGELVLIPLVAREQTDVWIWNDFVWTKKFSVSKDRISYVRDVFSPAIVLYDLLAILKNDIIIFRKRGSSCGLYSYDVNRDTTKKLDVDIVDGDGCFVHLKSTCPWIDHYGKVEVISREIIKPENSTPHHLRKIRLSSLDQLATANYVPLILFYSSVETPDQLKKSLSETLNHYYPIAGRIKDSEYIDCNDEGVDFVESRVNCELSEFLDQVKIDELEQFLPCDCFVAEGELSWKPLLAIQVNIFDCGGVAIGICISHKIGDGVSIALFLNSWAAITRGANPSIPPMSFDLSSYFPMKESPNILPSKVDIQPNFLCRRFIFDASNITELRALSCKVQNPTRVELVSALIWWRGMAIRTQGEDNSTEGYAAVHALNLRRRMVPPLPENTFGNLARPTITQIVTEEMGMEYDDLVGYIRDSIVKIDGDYIRELQGGNEGFMNSVKEVRQPGSNIELVGFNFNSWCRFPFYEVDFGRGTPDWVATTGIPSKNLVILIDTISGDGIEAWVNMLEKDMSKLENDQVFFSFASPKS